MQTTELDLARTARLFHALSDPTRLELIQRLAGGECCVCELQDALDAAQSRLSFHLKTLKEAGLVTDRRAGRWVFYSLTLDALAELEQWVGDLRLRGLQATPAGGCCG
jgi:ArsR family transcriptional regulator